MIRTILILFALAVVAGATLAFPLLAVFVVGDVQSWCLLAGASLFWVAVAHAAVAGIRLDGGR